MATGLLAASPPWAPLPLTGLLGVGEKGGEAFFLFLLVSLQPLVSPPHISLFLLTLQLDHAIPGHRPPQLLTPRDPAPLSLPQRPHYLEPTLAFSCLPLCCLSPLPRVLFLHFLPQRAPAQTSGLLSEAFLRPRPCDHGLKLRCFQGPGWGQGRGTWLDMK